MSAQKDSKENGGYVASITPLQQMLSSCSGALMTSMFVTPLDVVKIRLQAQQKTTTTVVPRPAPIPVVYRRSLMECIRSHCLAGGRVTPGAAVKNSVSENVKFTGTIDAMVKIARVEGLTSLWSGLPATLMMTVPATICYFTTYDVLKYRMGYRESDTSTRHIPVIAGAAARVFTTTLINPMELIRTKMQSEMLSYQDLGRAVRTTVRDGGWMVFMRGLGPSLLRDVPFSATYWFGYEYLKAFQMRQAGMIGITPTMGQSFIAGAASGTVAAVATLPFDVIKTHRQIELGQAGFMKGQKLTPTYTLMIKLYTEKGIQGLFAGIVPRIAKVTPACAIMITSYEYGKAFFRDKNQALTR